MLDMQRTLVDLYQTTFLSKKWIHRFTLKFLLLQKRDFFFIMYILISLYPRFLENDMLLYSCLKKHNL